jgi:hypothetical protein
MYLILKEFSYLETVTRNLVNNLQFNKCKYFYELVKIKNIMYGFQHHHSPYFTIRDEPDGRRKQKRGGAISRIPGVKIKKKNFFFHHWQRDKISKGYVAVIFMEMRKSLFMNEIKFCYRSLRLLAACLDSLI